MNLRSAALPFAVAARAAGVLLWCAAGPGQATLLRDIAPGARSSTPRPCVEFDGRSFFAACPQGNGVTFFLYRTDGTAAGTAQWGSNPVGAELARAGSRLYYTAQTAATGMELWVSDGVTPGAMVADLQPGAAGSFPSQLVALGDRLLFLATTPAGARLHVTDGTAAGTVDLGPVAASGFGTRRLVEQGGRVFFAGADGEPWKSDGTAAGTVLVKDVRPGPAGSNPGQWTAYQGRVWFVADDGASGNELWLSDGTALGTALFLDYTPGAGGTAFVDFTIAGGQMFFPIGTRLFVTDGFLAGTREVLANPPFSFVNGANFGTLAAHGSAVFFAGNHPATGTELWRSDGTSAGTWMVKDVWPGAGSGLAGAQRMSVLGSRFVYFVAQDAANGAELWRSDGTTNGTQVAIDFTPGAGGSFGTFAPTTMRANLVRGQLVYDPFDANVWQEPFGSWPGASSQPIGWGCGASLPVPRTSRLAATDGVLGGVVTFEGFDAPGGSLGAIVLGFPAPNPLQLGNGCRLWMDANTAATLPYFWNTAGGWQSNLALPLLPSLSGLLLVAQCFYFGSNAPGGYEGSNGVLLGLGV